MNTPIGQDSVTTELERHRPLLLAIAYRMLGSVAEAEDIVQEASLRYEQAVAEGVEVRSLKAYLSTVVTRLAIDHLRSAQARRELYVGEWLPEPLLADETGDPAVHTEEADTLSMAFLLVLERLSPVERAVFLLHDVFAYEYDEIAAIVGKGEAKAANSRSERDATSRRRSPASERRDCSAASSPRASSPQSRTAMSTGSSSCWPRTWSP